MNFGSTTIQAIREYTDTQSTVLNTYIVTLCGLNKDATPEFNIEKWTKIAHIMSAIYNSPRTTTIVYQSFKPDYKEFELGRPQTLTALNREDTSSAINVVINSTTASREVLKYLSAFHGDTCCIRAIRLVNFPTLNISSRSLYPYQEEIILPPFIKIDTTERFIKDFMEYSKQDIIDCTIKAADKYVLNAECIRSKNLGPTPIKDLASMVKTITLDRDLMDSINNILKGYYNCDRTANHGFVHICNTIVLSAILYLDYVEQREENRSFDEIKTNLEHIIVAALFHDCGRDCKDGVDMWEDVSAKRAVEVLRNSGISQERVLEVERIMTDGSCTLNKIMKGADSIDIVRVRGYHQTRNPMGEIYTELNMDSSLISQDTLADEFDSLNKILRIISEATAISDGERHKIVDTLFVDYEGDEEPIAEKLADLNTNKNLNILVEANSKVCTILELDTDGDKVVANLTPFGTYTGFNKRYFEKTMKNRDIITEMAESIATFNNGCRNMCSYFVEQQYFSDPNRFFDDYIEILLCFLPVLPYSLRHLCKVIFPFRVRNL